MPSPSIAQTASSHLDALAKFPRSQKPYYETLVANYGMQTSSSPLRSQYLSLCSYSYTKRPSDFPYVCSLSGTSIENLGKTDPFPMPPGHLLVATKSYKDTTSSAHASEFSWFKMNPVTIHVLPSCCACFKS
ncbi:hypothetical protein HBH98_012260 [Parastagonospora nodorum]|nr:hypothetical protein HBH50_109860 [Parastagonospora nodorum]KAH4088247.1 hypothetical protein HBH48_126830 [Parastagonospora nodorum]KAH4353904.1 hypothetical protein HBH98_012260 [Parastagonospora nodorum]KAH4397401.1 hypothetical protein HBH97_002670 [Parastagonospora nodorum]KAH4429661.1 hypothetical protein HBH99_012320 [Parastagonospora nodorum]